MVGPQGNSGHLNCDRGDKDHRVLLFVGSGLWVRIFFTHIKSLGWNLWAGSDTGKDLNLLNHLINSPLGLW